jgi:diketogulonate reductase-like aldo/keto reductase
LGSLRETGSTCGATWSLAAEEQSSGSPAEVMESVIEKVVFPDSWNCPTVPGYGLFPGPFVSETLSYAQVARGFQCHIEQALAIGYRHIDTAFTYRNQDLIGVALKARGIARREVFVTSKLHPNNNAYRDARSKIEEALRLIWGDGFAESERYLDAFLLHYPGIGDPLEAWKALLETQERGLVRHLGVSNFEGRHLEKVFQKTGRWPEINQIELHPYLYHEQRELIQFCKDRGIALEGYCPLAQGKVVNDPRLRTIADRHGTTPARVALRWCMQHGVRPIVGTRDQSHMEANARPYTFTLSEEEMLRIDSLGAGSPTRLSLQWGWNSKTAPLGGSSLLYCVRVGARRVLARFTGVLDRSRRA